METHQVFGTVAGDVLSVVFFFFWFLLFALYENPYLEELKEDDINDSFPKEKFYVVYHLMNLETPWFTNLTKYLAVRVFPVDLDYHARRKFFSELKHYYWEHPFLFQVYGDQVI